MIVVGYEYQPDQGSVFKSKKNTQTLASASFPRFCWPFLSPVWWLPAFFLVPSTKLCSHARRHPLGGCAKRCSFSRCDVLTGEIPSEFRSWGQSRVGYSGKRTRCWWCYHIGSTGKDVAAFSKVS